MNLIMDEEKKISSKKNRNETKQMLNFVFETNGIFKCSIKRMALANENVLICQ